MLTSSAKALTADYLKLKSLKHEVVHHISSISMDEEETIETLQSKLKLDRQSVKILSNLLKRGLVLGQAIAQFELIYLACRAKSSIQEISVTTASDISTEMKLMIKARLAEILKHAELVISFKNDPQIIGGITFETAEHFIDASYKRHLEVLEKIMLNKLEIDI